MIRAASVSRDERVRLFCALRLPDEATTLLAAWQERAFAAAPAVRIVPRAHLHLTLAFLGHRPTTEIVPVVEELRAAAAAAAGISLRLRGYRETRSVGMLTFEDAGGAATALAADLHARLERLRVYEPEQRRWLPHITVLRFGRPPRLRPELPELRPLTPSDAALYHSVLRSGGAQYEVIEAVALGG